jgi:hypothetical protein
VTNVYPMLSNAAQQRLGEAAQVALSRSCSIEASAVDADTTFVRFRSGNDTATTYLKHDGSFVAWKTGSRPALEELKEELGGGQHE